MRKLYSLVLLGLLASTNPIFAMDEITDGTDIGAQSDKFSAASPTNMMEVSSREVPEGNDVPWYDDEVASGSPDARGRAKSFDKEGDGWGEADDALAELAAKWSTNSTSDPLAASVMMNATTHRAKLSLAEMAEEDNEDSLPKTAAHRRHLSSVDDRVEGETSTVVAAPSVIYFGSIPNRTMAEDTGRGLLKGKNTTLASNQLKLVLSYLFEPGQDERPKAGFDFDDFARKLDSCEDTEAQIKFLTKMAYEHRAAWESEEEGDAEEGLDD